LNSESVTGKGFLNKLGIPFISAELTDKLSFLVPITIDVDNVPYAATYSAISDSLLGVIGLWCLVF
jgi:hypothetical protein